jgi:glutathione S-transferase
MKLSHIPGSRSCRVRWLLEELGLEYDLEQLSLADGSLKTEAYRAKNPHGRVPTFEDAGITFFESGAIVQYLLERYGEGRLEPAIGSPLRPVYLQWFHWGEATFMPPHSAIMANRFVLKEADRSEVALAVAQRQLSNVLQVLDTALDGKTFLVGGEFTAADIMVGYACSLAKMVGALPEEVPSVHRWLAGLAARPAYQRAFEGGLG